jgi:hypothetical protein
MAGKNTTWLEQVTTQWGGHIKAGGIVSRPDQKSILQATGASETLLDGFSSLRLQNLTSINPELIFEVHYEAQLSGGELQRQRTLIEKQYPEEAIGGSLPSARIQDDRRLFDLTAVITEDEDHLFYHRLDRLLVSYHPQWGALVVGRQALTFGNGLLFNPMDLFNPFAPTDMERDYKVGDDMLTARCTPSATGELSLIGVPRRDSNSGQIAWDSSSVAANYHTSLAAMEMDMLIAKHYQEKVIGLGGSGYFMDAAWRMDATWTDRSAYKSGDDYLALVANLDYAWILWQKNFYGLIEYYHNGLGHVDPAEAALDPLVREKIARGEIFTLGRNYLGSQIQVEIHPLLRIEANLIVNLDDGSGLTQPRIVWDIAQDLRLTSGARFYFGNEGSELGGFPIPGSDLFQVPLTRAYLWLTYYF